MAKSLSARQVLSIKRRSITLGDGWDGCFGAMDRHGVVFIWGNSGNGKSSAVASLAKALTAFGPVLFVSLEEGYSLSLQNTFKRFGLQDCGSRIQVLESASIDDLDERLSRPKSAEFVIVDSFQYLQISYKRYIAFKERHRNKLLIFVSHAEGKQPATRAARSVKYDASLKVWVEGYKAFSKGRFIGPTGEKVIWEQGAAEYWGEPGGDVEPQNHNDDDYEQQ